MTQEVQPLTWQKRTNLEEHQQFFAKINEIIANLAPTVNEAEAAIASANAAIATANAASASADAASQQAQTAANIVAGYDGRMAAVESKDTQQDSSIAALQTADGQNVKLSGNQNIDGIKTAPTEATGARSQQIANSAKVGAELDAYQPMVRTTGNKVISGVTEFIDSVFGSSYYGIVNKKADFSALDRTTNKRAWLMFLKDSEDRNLIRGFYDNVMDGTNQFILSMALYDTDGTSKEVTILRIVTDASHNITTVQVGGKTI